MDLQSETLRVDAHDMRFAWVVEEGYVDFGSDVSPEVQKPTPFI